MRDMSRSVSSTSHENGIDMRRVLSLSSALFTKSIVSFMLDPSRFAIFFSSVASPVNQWECSLFNFATFCKRTSKLGKLVMQPYLSRNVQKRTWGKDYVSGSCRYERQMFEVLRGPKRMLSREEIPACISNLSVYVE